MIGPALFSSARPDWGTPAYVFDPLQAEFGFDLDVCACAENAKCSRYFTLDPSDPEVVEPYGLARVDGLGQSWQGRVCWMNPPYGKAIGPWVMKARAEAERGALVVGLLPLRCDAGWWAPCFRADEWRIVRGRLRFEGAPASAPFPSVLVVWRPRLLQRSNDGPRVSWVRYGPAREVRPVEAVA